MFRALTLAVLLAVATVPASAAEWRKLLTPGELAEINTGEILILDIRGSTAYSQRHVAGAVNAPYPMWRGPSDNPGQALTEDYLTVFLQSLGVEREKPVVITYAGKNATDFGSAARVYWTLKSAGVEQIAILNGGLKAWRNAGLELTYEPVKPARSDIHASLSDQWMLTREGVLDVVEGRSEARLVDARPLAFFEGKAKHRAAKNAGTLEGALNLVHSNWFVDHKNQMISTPETAETIARNAGYDGEKDDGEVLVSFCNTGHWAATNWFALSEIAGIENVKLYPESMVGWSNALLPTANAN